MFLLLSHGPLTNITTQLGTGSSAEGNRNGLRVRSRSLGFIRLLSNPAFSPDALAVPEALELLIKNVNQPAHEFWPDALTAPRALKPLMRDAFGHRQLTDGYLLSLALRHKARLATFDRGLLEFATEAQVESHVELVSPR